MRADNELPARDIGLSRADVVTARSYDGVSSSDIGLVPCDGQNASRNDAFSPANGRRPPLTSSLSSARVALPRRVGWLSRSYIDECSANVPFAQTDIDATPRTGSIASRTGRMMPRDTFIQ